MDELSADGRRERDAFTAAYWNGRVRVVVHAAPSPAVADVRQRARALFGREIEAATWGRLVGAPDDAAVDVLPSPAPDYRYGIQLRVHHPWFDGPAIRYVFVDVDGDLAMVDDRLFIHHGAPPGVGTRVLAHQVAAARSLGVLYILAEAAGGPGSTMNGYYTWARLGFDGPIPAQVWAQFPAEWRDIASVLDLIERPGGTSWWRGHRRGYDGTFDLREGSRSRRILQDYTVEKGIII